MALTRRPAAPLFRSVSSQPAATISVASPTTMSRREPCDHISVTPERSLSRPAHHACIGSRSWGIPTRADSRAVAPCSLPVSAPRAPRAPPRAAASATAEPRPRSRRRRVRLHPHGLGKRFRRPAATFFVHGSVVAWARAAVQLRITKTRSESFDASGRKPTSLNTTRWPLSPRVEDGTRPLGPHCLGGIK